MIDILCFLGVQQVTEYSWTPQIPVLSETYMKFVTEWQE